MSQGWAEKSEDSLEITLKTFKNKKGDHYMCSEEDEAVNLRTPFPKQDNGIH